MRKVGLIAALVVGVVGLVAGYLYLAPGPRPPEGGKKTVAMVFPVTVDTFVRFRQACEGELKQKDVEVEWFSAEGDASRFNTSIKAALLKKPALLVTVGTQITNTAFGPQFEADLPPVLAACISDPAKAESLVKIGLEPPRSRKVAIISDASRQDMYAQSAESIEQVFGAKRTFGVIYNEADIVSKNTATKLADALTSRGHVAVRGLISGGDDIDRVTKDLIAKKVNLICIPHDKHAAGRATTIVKLGLEASPAVPVFALDEGMVRKDKAALGVSLGYDALGRATAVACLKILGGDDPAAMPLVQEEKATVFAHADTLARLGVALPPGLAPTAVVVSDKP